ATYFYGNSLGIQQVTAYVLRGNGDGTFFSGPVSPAGYFGAVAPGTAVGLAAADVYGNGKLDLITVGTPYGATGGTVVDILPNNGTSFGTDQASLVYTVAPSSPAGFVMGNFDGNRTADVAIAGANPTGGYDIAVLLGKKK